MVMWRKRQSKHSQLGSDQVKRGGTHCRICTLEEEAADYMNGQQQGQIPCGQCCMGTEGKGVSS